MEKKDICGDCEETFSASELYYPTAENVAWAKSIGHTLSPVCDPCAERAFDTAQENLTRFANSI